MKKKWTKMKSFMNEMINSGVIRKLVNVHIGCGKYTKIVCDICTTKCGKYKEN